MPDAVEVGVDDVAVDLLVEWVLDTDRDDAGVGDDDVDLAEPVDTGLHGRRELREVADIGDDRNHPPAERLDGRDGLVEIGPGRQGIGDGVEVGAAVDRDDVGALGGQRHRVGSALAARRAGDHCDAAYEV